MTTVAVVMATYNGGRFIAEQLASIARQERLPDLLVVSDDGSSDATLEIACEFAKSAPFETRIMRGPGAGLACNFWRAAQMADADLIAWADQDDIWLPGKLARCEAALLGSGAGFVSHSALTIDAAGRSLRRKHPDYRASRVHPATRGDPWHVPSGFASMFRRSLITGVPFRQRPRSHQTLRPMNHDHVVSLRSFVTCKRVELSTVLARYRQHDGNAAGDPTQTGIGAIRQTLRPRENDFSQLARIACDYGRFVSALGATSASADYFRALAERCEQRARVYRAASNRDRISSIVTAAGRGAYAARRRGGFGTRGLARDAGLSVLISIPGVGSVLGR